MPLDLHTRATFSPTTLDRKARTVDVVLSTGAPVLRFGFEGQFTEQLAVTPEAVDLSRLPVALLDGTGKMACPASLERWCQRASKPES